MLNKSILLNFTIAKNEFAGAIITALAGCLLGSLLSAFSGISPAPGIGLITGGTLISLFLIFKAMHLIFNKSLFDEGGGFFMTLPLSPGQIVLGKIIAVTVVTLLVGVLITITSMLPVMLSEDSRGIALEAMTTLLVSKEALASASPESAALLMAIIPLNITVQQFSSCGLFFAAALLCNLKKPGKVSALPWVIYFPASSLFSMLIEKTGNLLFKNTGGLPFSVTSTLIYLMLSILFVFICCRILNHRYNY